MNASSATIPMERFWQLMRPEFPAIIGSYAFGCTVGQQQKESLRSKITVNLKGSATRRIRVLALGCHEIAVEMRHDIGQQLYAEVYCRTNLNKSIDSRARCTAATWQRKQKEENAPRKEQ